MTSINYPTTTPPTLNSKDPLLILSSLLSGTPSIH